MSKAILIVDDDRSVTTSLALLLKQAGYSSRCAASPAEALEILDGEKFSLVIQDMNFSRETTGEEGLAMLESVKQRHPQLPVILITAWGSISLAVRGVKAGASDFVTKPWTNQQLLQSVETTLGLAQATAASAAPAATRGELDAQFDFGNVIGHDPKMLKVLEVVGRVSATDASVLITGESGTGKEVIAEAIHRNSRRKSRPFVKVNLGGISSTLFESEMFGHVRGAFTDARQDRKGRFEMAHGGTIFLDEIGELDPNSQVKLLRVLQDRTYEQLGSSVTRTVDVRVISATNRNLADLVAGGEFREDLLYRLNLIAVHVPPLSERVDDVPLLANHFLENISHVYRRSGISITDAAARWLRSLDWPGNVRQLKHLIERTVLMSGKRHLDVEDFALPVEMETGETRKDMLPTAGSMTLDEIEKTMILKCLKRFGGNLSKVADALGLSRQTLYRRLEKYGINP
jgi:DNA-binding NtrC family response regulator